MKLYQLTFFFLFISLISYGQETVEEIEEPNTIENQFDKIFRISTKYQNNKVINIDRFLRLKKGVLDSLKTTKQLVLEKENLLKIERTNNQKTTDTLKKTQQDLEVALNKENTISLFGAQLNKTTYNLILWGIIILLFFGLVYFIFKFSKSSIVTKKAENNLLNVEEEFEVHRKKSLEREQKLRRQLQDEINKQRNS